MKTRNFAPTQSFRFGFSGFAFTNSTVHSGLEKMMQNRPCEKMTGKNRLMLGHQRQGLVARV